MRAKRVLALALSVLVALALCVTALPKTALAAPPANGDLTVDGTPFVTSGAVQPAASNGSVPGASYDGNANTLTLDGYSGGRIFANHMGADFTISLNGGNTVTTDTGDAIQAADGALTVGGTGNLTVSSTNGDGIFCERELTFQSGLGTVTVTTGAANGGKGIHCYDGHITIDGGNFTVTARDAALWTNDPNKRATINDGTLELRSAYQAVGDAAPALPKHMEVAIASRNYDGSSPASSYDANLIADYKYLKIEPQDLVIVGGSGYTYESGLITITAPGAYVIHMYGAVTTTTDRIIVAGGQTVSLELHDVTINTNGGSALDLGPGANVTLKLGGLGQGTNTLQSNTTGIHLGTNASLTIEGGTDDALTVAGPAGAIDQLAQLDWSKFTVKGGENPSGAGAAALTQAEYAANGTRYSYLNFAPLSVPVPAADVPKTGDDAPLLLLCGLILLSGAGLLAGGLRHRHEN